MTSRPLAPGELTPDALADFFERLAESDIAKTIDHSLLRPELDDAFVEDGCRLAAEYDYRELVKPLHAELFSFIRARTRAKVLFHSCGAIQEQLPDLVEIGVDVLNPVQVSAAGMETAALKRDFGRDLVFWGGGVDTQGVLGSGTPDDVRAEVRRRVADLAPGGGFIFASVHNVQANVPPENVAAMWEAVEACGAYAVGAEAAGAEAAGAGAAVAGAAGAGAAGAEAAS